MEDDLSKEFDLVVMGTGLIESCIAAAASRIGKTVLHLDRNEFYGDSWASFSLESFINLLQQKTENEEIRNCSYEWHVYKKCKLNSGDVTTGELRSENLNSKNEKSSEEISVETVLMNQSRRFNLDLCPKLLYSAGPLVQLLITSNICRYAEFRSLDFICTRFHNELINVPCSRSDVFNSKDLNVVEKRLLMKVLNDCLVFGEEKRLDDELNNRGKTFREFLKEQKVTEKISVCIMQAIAMCNDDTSFEEGIKRTQNFLRSLGRYGNTPFLFPMYGCGEIPQCFCRLCAVFGGVYCLKCTVSDIYFNNETQSINLKIENGNNVQCKYVVSSYENLPKELKQNTMVVNNCSALENILSRGIFITSTPLGDEKFNSGGGGVNLLRLVDKENEAILIQLSHFSATCPKGYFIIHITTPALSDKPAKDLEPFLKQVFQNDIKSPDLLFSSYFTLWGVKQTTTALTTTDIPLFCTMSPCYELDYDNSIQNAKDIFKKLYPDAEFLPRAPNPDEILVDGEDPLALSEVSLPDDLKAQLEELEQSTGGMEIDNNDAINTVQEME